GQNSYGGGGGDSAGWQKSLADYCQDDTFDVIPLAFVNIFFGTGGYPELNLANTCNVKDNSTFPSTGLLSCPNVGADIKFCQSRGKSILLSLGGAGGSYGFQNDTQAQHFATQIWNLFLGGKSDIRPFGDTILDGVDLDIEGGGPTGYVALINQLRDFYNQDKGKKYMVTGAPQCVYPDSQLSTTLNNAWFDLVFVQFYNNPCGLQYYNNSQAWNFGVWDYWATHISLNPQVKVYIGAPAAPSASGSGYVPLQQLQVIAEETRANFTSFGGIMFWDASQAWGNMVGNGNYAQGVKQFLKGNGGCHFKPSLPACTSVPTWAASDSYPGQSVVSYEGYFWKALWWVQGQKPGAGSGYWNAIGGFSSAYTPSSTSSTTQGISCIGVSSWSSSLVYSAPQKVVYNDHLWQAKWWSQNNLPGKNGEDVWMDLGSCTGPLKQVEPLERRSEKRRIVKQSDGYLITLSMVEGNTAAGLFQLGVSCLVHIPLCPEFGYSPHF
ncbi:glycoside hydrolase, partial [Basidiobolus meristosporus CBS 931.73]